MAADSLSTISPTSNYSFIPSLFLYDLSFLCSIIISHPLYSSLLILLSPYLLKLISPLFFTTSLLLILSLLATSYPPSKLGLIQTVVDQFRAKMNRVHEDDEFREFEEFEIFKIVFRDPPLLLTDGEGKVKQATELEEERRLERLFEELDRFEVYTTEIEATKKTRNETRLVDERFDGELGRLVPVAIPVSGEDEKALGNLFSVKVSSCGLDSSTFGESTMGEEEENENETRPIAEGFAGELRKLAPVAVPVSGEDKKALGNLFSVEVSSCWPDSSTIENSTTPIEKSVNENENEKETRSIPEELAGELQIPPIAVPISRDDKQTLENFLSVKVSQCRPDSSTFGDSVTTIDKEDDNQNERRSQIKKAAEELQKSEPAKVSSTKTVENSLTVKSNPTRSHVLGVIQKFETVGISAVSIEEQKPVHNSFSLKSNSWRSDSSSSFGSYGSMRKEKEWKRTLACKLFEERHNSGGEEGMDSLWEAYEDDTSNKRSTHRKKTETKTEGISNKKKTMIKHKSEFKYFDDGKAEQEQEDEDDDDEFMSNGQLCCLKALKLSTGKMNLGMGKPNLVKISKVLKGFGWLHHVGSSKQGKKH